MRYPIIFFKPSELIQDEKIASACDKMHVSHFFSDFRFCPILYCKKEEIDGKLVTEVGNTNEGHYNYIKKQDYPIIEVNDLKSFVLEVYKL